MAKQAHSLEELRRFHADAKAELHRLELDMARAYARLTFSEIRAYDDGAARIGARIATLERQIKAAERKMELEKEEKGLKR